MALEIDVLIHFADKDNETAKKNEIGWVSNFKRFLELMLYQVLGTKPNIILKSEYDSATASTLDNASVMVTILSKDFVKFIFSEEDGHIYRNYIVASECIIQDINSSICGTVDLLIKLPNKIPIIIDFKSAKFTTQIQSHQLQLMMYGYLLESSGIISIQNIIYLGGENFIKIEIKKR